MIFDFLRRFRSTRTKNGRISPALTRVIVRVADFSNVPAGLTDLDGPFNATRFREDVLVPAFNTGHVVVVDLDGVAGYAHNWLTKSFGELTAHGFDAEYVLDHLEIKYKLAESMYRTIIWSAIRREKL